MVVAVRAEAILTAQNKMRPGLNAAARDLEKFQKQQTKTQQLLSAGAARLALVAGGAFAGVAGVGALKEATKRFAEVDRAMTRTGITGDATVEQTRKGTAALRDMAIETAQRFDPMQKGLDAITASGREFGEAMAMMPSVAKTAQASGAEINDIANASTALMDHMKISVEGLAEAQDTLAMGGKLGKFELKDMARYLPSMLPAFKAIGASGQEGLRDLVSVLQVIRSGTGTAEEAAASAQNIFAKMESDETVKNFKEFGIDLPKAMTKARKEGKNLLDVFLDLSGKALKGDMSKLPQLFKDMEVQRGMRPLIADMAKILEYREKLKGAKGTIDTDFLRVSKDTRAALDRFAEAADRAKTALGSLAAEAAAPLVKAAADRLNELGQAMERAAEAARDEGFTGALKRLGKDIHDSVEPYGPRPQDDMESYASGRDGVIADQVAARGRDANSRPADGYAEADLAREIAELRQVLELAGPGSVRDRAAERLRLLESKGGRQPYLVDVSDAEMNAILRDQQRRAGYGDIPGFSTTGRDFDGAREALREAMRGKSLSGLSGSGDFPNGPIKTRPGSVQPPRRPGNLGIDLAPVSGLDDVKSKSEAAASSFGLLGPAAQTAGSEISAGFVAAEGSIDRLAGKVARLKQDLASLRMPSMSVSGLPVGKQGPN